MPIKQIRFSIVTAMAILGFFALRHAPRITSEWSCLRQRGALKIERGPANLVAFICEMPTHDVGLACEGRASECEGACLKKDPHCVGDQCPGVCAASKSITLYPKPPLEHDTGLWI